MQLNGSTNESYQAMHYRKRRENVDVSIALCGACVDDGVTGGEENLLQCSPSRAP